MCVNFEIDRDRKKSGRIGPDRFAIELRRTLDIGEKDALEIYVDGGSIILKKYAPSCVFCNDTNGVTTYKVKNVCAACMRELKRL